MIKLPQTLLLILFCSISPFTYAADENEPQALKYYDVEIVIFKNVSVPRSPEINLPTPSANRTENTLELANPRSIKKAKKSGFVPLTVDELRLNDSVQRIIKSSRYELLLHTGWRQPGLDESNSIPVWVKGGKIFDSSYSSIDQMVQSNSQSGEITADPDNKRTGLRRQTMQGLYELEGQITIILSRYLHTRTELVLRKPSDMNQVLQQEALLTEGDDQELRALEGRLLFNYALNEQRRMRSRKLHYLDHPEFGLLILITPYEQPLEDSIESKETDIPAKVSTLVN